MARIARKREDYINWIQSVALKIYDDADEIIGDVKGTCSIHVEFDIELDKIPTYKVEREKFVPMIGEENGK